MLSRHVKTFTYFPTAYINDVFLDMLNFKPDGPDDLGVCTRLIRYQAASSAKRLGLPPPQFPGLRRPRKLDYKTEYLVYSIYVHGGWTEEQLAALFDISAPLVSDLVHTWAVFIGDYFAKCMPIPTRSQMLRAYPARILATFGHCRIFLHLDATEVRAEVPTNKEGHSAMHSTYKACSTIKFLAGVDPIGTAWPDSVSEGFPGAVSDPAQTKATGIIRKNIPGGHCVCVDKGFLVENECAMCGVTCIRPTKKKSRSEAAKRQGDDSDSESRQHAHRCGAVEWADENGEPLLRRQGSYHSNQRRIRALPKRLHVSELQSGLRYWEPPGQHRRAPMQSCDSVAGQNRLGAYRCPRPP